MHHIRHVMTDNNTDHLTAKYKAGLALLMLESDMKPQNTCTLCAHQTTK